MRSADSEDMYFSTIGSIPILGRDQVVDLAKGIEAGVFAQEILDDPTRAEEYQQATVDGELPVSLIGELEELAKNGEQAKMDLITANLKLVVSIAKGYQGRGLDLADLIQEGNTGLIHAVEKFDHTKGFTFSTYAVDWIHQRIKRALAISGRAIRLPDRVHRAVNEMTAVEMALMNTLGREATLIEIAERMGRTSEEIRNLKEYRAIQPFSLDVSVTDEDGVTPFGSFVQDGDSAPVDERLLQQENVTALYAMLDHLLPIEREIIVQRLGLHRKEALDENVAEKISRLSRDAVAALARKALSKLRHPSVSSISPFIAEDDWRHDDPLCAEIGLEPFYPQKGETIRVAKEICAACDLQSACLNEAIIKEEDFGVWGGQSAKQRKLLQKKSELKRENDE